jgi:glycogen operon protein
MALLSTLFASRGTIMLTAGDEAGRSQRGNNNAYCQDNAITWVDWASLDQELIDHTGFLAKLRKRFPIYAETRFLTGSDVEWLSPSGAPMTVEQWQTPACSTLAMLLTTIDQRNRKPARLAVLINRGRESQSFTLPAGQDGPWRMLSADGEAPAEMHISIPSRTIRFLTQSR